jgi:hypothetical protein
MPAAGGRLAGRRVSLPARWEGSGWSDRMRYRVDTLPSGDDGLGGDASLAQQPQVIGGRDSPAVSPARSSLASGIQH